MTLKDKRIAVCATRRVEDVIDSIAKLGGKPYVEDVVKLTLLPEEEVEESVRSAIKESPEVFYLTTGEGTDLLLRISQKMGIYKTLMALMERGMVFARGYKVRGKLISYGFKNFQSIGSTEAFMNLLRNASLKGTKIFVQMYGEDMQELELFLNSKGAKMLKVWLYKYDVDKERLDGFIKKLLESFYHAVLFTSAYQVDYLFKRAKEKNLGRELSICLNSKLITVAVGRKTAEKLFENGVIRVYYPEKERLVYALKELERAFGDG